MKKEKILIFNISTDSEDMALGFAINWINKFSEYYDEIDVVTLNKGNTQLLNENINVYSHEFDNFNKIQKFVVLRKIVKKLIRDNEYKYCLSHMTTALLVVGSTIFRFRSLKSVLWYTHIGPSTIFKKIILRLGANIADKIVTASDNSFPFKMEKVTTIGHAISYKYFFRDAADVKSKDFLILSRISIIKNIDESIQGFLNSSFGETQSITIVGGPLTKEDEVYENYLKDKYSQYPNIKFVGSIPHKDLSSFIEQFGFHINNTALGSYDKSVLETMAAGIINFYTNSDYDKNIPSKYEKVLKYNGTIDDLTKKIHSVDELKNKELHEIITFSQNSVKNESLETIHERITKVI